MPAPIRPNTEAAKAANRLAALERKTANAAALLRMQGWLVLTPEQVVERDLAPGVAELAAAEARQAVAERLAATVADLERVVVELRHTVAASVNPGTPG